MSERAQIHAARRANDAPRVGPDGMVEYTIAFPFCGLGGGALGFMEARGQLLGKRARFVNLGGIDNCPSACRNFEYLTGAPALCADMSTLTRAALRAFYGESAPDGVFLSPPCKSYSALLNAKLRVLPKYVTMSRLALVCLELFLTTWDEPPRLILFENVPRITSLGAELLAEVRALLELHGYVLHEESFDCAEIGGGAQHRRRYLLVARRPARVGAVLERPPIQRVRACGEVLGTLPLPEDPDAGPMHTLSRLSWSTWCLLAMIPPGGDYRDVPGVLAELQARREVFRRHHVLDPNEPAPTVGGPGSNGAEAIADWRVGDGFTNLAQMADWQSATRAVVGATRPMGGGISVADPRLPDEDAFVRGHLRVESWPDPSGAVTGNGRIGGSGAQAVADPRVEGRAFYTVDDPRVVEAARALSCKPYADTCGVVAYDSAIGTITASGDLWNGAFCLGDPRYPAAPPAAIVDRADRSPFVMVERPGKTARSKPRVQRVEVPVVIVSKHGTWNRPITPLDAALLQGLPAIHKGHPLLLDGTTRGNWLEQIGNAVPTWAAKAIGGQFLITLLSSDFCAGLLPSGGTVWVTPDVAAPIWGLDSAPRLEVLHG